MEALRHAVHAWDQVERPYQQALASHRLAELLLNWAGRRSLAQGARQAAREEAEMLLDKTLAVYEHLQIPTGKAAIQALRSRTHLEAQRKRRSTLQARQPFQGLTQREMQVLVHLAAGRTNREIAAALSMSVRTAGLHVSHILSKLNCVTRTQATAYAISQGWLK
jgi:DNA-binding NarL/FixJ family response regulator